MCPWFSKEQHFYFSTEDFYSLQELFCSLKNCGKHFLDLSWLHHTGTRSRKITIALNGQTDIVHGVAPFY